MSSSEQATFQQSTDNDATMMEAPDSPPDTSHLPVLANSSQPSTSGQTNSNRVNGESNTKVSHGAPGSTWTTKKFQEEYERANTQVLDQNWDATRYGDPLMD